MKVTSRLLCSLCRGVDHTRNECALAYLHPKSPPTSTNLYAYQDKGVQLVESRFLHLSQYMHVYNHICATCPGAAPHPACEWPKTPGDSFFKQKRVPRKCMNLAISYILFSVHLPYIICPNMLVNASFLPSLSFALALACRLICLR